MGKDIHLLTEIRKNEAWEPIEDIPESYDIRNYSFFGILEEIGTRGIPKELEGKRFRYNEQYDYWEFDLTEEYLFNHAYITLEELINHTKKMNKITVSEEFLELFFELGGVLPEGMSIDKEDGGILVEVEDEYERNTKEIFKDGIKELELIANKYGVTSKDLRLVFAFDW